MGAPTHADDANQRDSHWGPDSAVKRLRFALYALLALAALGTLARLFLILNFDRQGGVTCIWLRNRPALAWQEFSAADAPASHALSLICGNENGVVGEDLLDWNARFGWWLFSTAALALSWANVRMSKSSR
jgi:hypothetical protein